MDAGQHAMRPESRPESLAAWQRPPAVRRFKGRLVLVTGASSGIGQALAVAFAWEGARIAVNYHRDLDGAEETLRQAHAARGSDGSGHDLLLQGDVSDEDTVDRMFDTLDEEGGVDILVNNAGVQVEEPAHAADVEAFDKPIAINLRGPFLCARRAIQGFLKRGDSGVIVNVSSVHENIPKPLFVGYAASKGGLGNVTRTLALEYAGRGIRVNAVGPGAIETPINKDWVDDPEQRREVEAHIPLGWVGKPEDVAAAVLFLASDEARYITGQTLFVDGGLTLYPEFRTPWSS